jgi:hypothetical protein
MKKHYIINILMLALLSCRKPYNPPAISSPNSYLVVEGVINPGPDSTIIVLSRTVNLSAATTANPETGAVVAVEGNNNTSYALTETSMGHYAVAGLTLDNTKQYRLSIKTDDNQQYLSAFVPVQITPPIDSIGFVVQANGLQLYANTHDPNNNTHYYRWDYGETWQFHSHYVPIYISNGKALVPRAPSQQISYCFGYDTSSTVILGSSAQLRQDVIYREPITTIASTSEKIETEYSILLRQYALTADAFNFWTNLKTNTEQLGGIFDAQPSNISGNIHNINNPHEPVIGYISACTAQTKRIFINNAQLPQTWLTVYPYQCTLDTLKLFPSPTALITLPVYGYAITGYYVGGNLAGYLATTIDCADCTIRGTTVQPAFWK